MTVKMKVFLLNDYIPIFLSGEYAVRFIPRENGVHNVHVTFDGCEIPDSPFRILIGKVDADPGMVTATGDGLRQGRTGWLDIILYI